MSIAGISSRIVVFKLAHGVWRRGEAASAGLSAALYSVYSGLYSEAVVSSVASALALAVVGRFREAVEYVQKAAKALYEAAKDVFEHVKITVQRLVELFVEAVARVLAWVDEHKAYLFLMAAVAAGVVALSAALNLWGLIEMEKLAYAASLTPFVAAGVKEYSREEVFNMLMKASDPYEEFREKIAKAANAGRIKLAEPWESLRVLILPKESEESRLIHSKAYRELDERKKKGLFYAALALEEAFGVYRSALGEYAEGLKKTVRRVEVGEGLFKREVYVADLGQIKQLAEEEGKAFENALSALRERLNEYAVKYGLRDLLDVEEEAARRLAEATASELSEFNDVNFGVKAYAALIAYREYALGRRGAFGTAVRYWLEVGGSAWPFYYPPKTAYDRTKKAGVERPVTVEELVAEGLRRLFLKPGADHYSRLIKELTKGGKLVLMPEKAKSAYVFRLYRVEEGGGLEELGVKLRISKVGAGEEAGITYTLIFDVERWLGFFKQELETAVKAAGEVGERLPVEDRFSYMGGWVDSDVAISKGRLMMGTSHLWQLAETHALFDWSKVVGLRMNLTLEGPKLVVDVETPLEKLDETIRRSAESGWLKMLGIKAESWEGLKQSVKENWGLVVDATVSRLRKVLKEEELERLLVPKGRDAPEGRKGGQEASRDMQKDGENVWEELRRRLEALRDRPNDNKVARKVVAPALLLIQAERLGVNETTLRYFGAVVSGAIDGDGHVSAAMRVVGLTSGERGIALLWGAVLAAYGIEAKVRRVRSTFQVIVSGGDAARLARLYFLYGPPLLERDDRLKNHKLDEAMKLGVEGLSVSWEGLRRRTEGGLVAADLTISESDTKIKYNVYLWEELFLQFQSTDRSRVELAARLLRLAGVGAEVKKRKDRDVWYIRVTTDRLATGHKELRNVIANIVRKAVEKGWIDAGKAGGWLEKLERGVTLMKGWPRYDVQLARSGALVVRFGSTDRNSIEREAHRFEKMGLKRGVHFSVKMPEEGRDGYVRILKKGLAYAAWLSVHGNDEAAKFVEYILQRAEEKGKEVYEKALKVVEEGKAWGSLTLKGFEMEVEVNGKKYKVKVIDGEAVEEGRGDRKLLRIRITAEVDGVRREYVMTYGRYGRDNAALGFATARADAPGGREKDAERFSALIKALTGREPKVYRRSDGVVMIECYEGHLEGFMRYKELAEAIKRWMEKTKRR
jgi:hypothetical protein